MSKQFTDLLDEYLEAKAEREKVKVGWLHSDDPDLTYPYREIERLNEARDALNEAFDQMKEST